jgi:putative copper export protein
VKVILGFGSSSQSEVMSRFSLVSHVLTGAVSIRTGRVILMMTVEMVQMKPTVHTQVKLYNVNLQSKNDD